MRGGRGFRGRGRGMDPSMRGNRGGPANL